MIIKMTVERLIFTLNAAGNGVMEQVGRLVDNLCLVLVVLKLETVMGGNFFPIQITFFLQMSVVIVCQCH